MTDENCPTVAGSWAFADETAMNSATAKQRSAIDRTFNRSEAQEQASSGRRRGSDFQPISGFIYTSKAETEDVSA